ncbi:metallophosphoesterase [Natranaeroarchaeum aerophilus]|uniref:Metallophosphoesterase n=1 Tax=Natranaeroarchaeum aerophilus TaxID=2917711 RepID=A0AAE3FSU8_9EURY|nr:metallophosphoesterase [Natranaeroarchaeum aerophilus]MCL9813949.1 metallophosphoesterase [Natranaeroarchaeum aerophilus]
MAGTTDPQVGRRSLYFPDADALVLADLHIGRDAASNVELPLGERGDLTERLGQLLDGFEPETVVFAGDILHAFDSVPLQAERTLSTLIETVENTGTRPVLVAGNHDRMLGTVWDGDTVEEHLLDDDRTVVLHGHEPPTVDADRYVIGHDHPAIEIEGQRRPCHLFGEGVYEGSDVFVLPAFNRLAPGILLNRTRQLGSPLIDDPDEFRPIVRDADAGETYRFPPLSEFRQLL